MNPETKQMLRFVVPVDDQPHEFRLSGNPVRVETTPNPNHVEFWAEGYPYADSSSALHRRFQVFGTGQPLPPNSRWYGTTARHSLGLVWHLYEVDL
jgi:hypothetical protein